MAALLAMVAFFFGGAYQAQSKFELCKEIKFESEKCKLQKKMSKY